MELLGYKSLHWGGIETRDAVRRAYKERRPILDYLDPAYEAFSNIEMVAARFKLVDRQYPGSFFVYTSRPVDDWVASRKRHVILNHYKKSIGEYDGDNLILEEQAWREYFLRHRRRVLKYFTGRPEFIELDTATQSKWEPLCDLLQRPVPDAPYPHTNKITSAYRKQTLDEAEAAKIDVKPPGVLRLFYRRFRYFCHDLHQ